jgi:hypothetical protein
MADKTSVISIPVFLVWNVQIPRRQKLTLIGMFSLTIIVVVSAVGRLIAVVANNNKLNGLDITWNSFWYNLEVAVGRLRAPSSMYSKSSDGSSHHHIRLCNFPPAHHNAQTQVRAPTDPQDDLARDKCCHSPSFKSSPVRCIPTSPWLDGAGTRLQTSGPGANRRHHSVKRYPGNAGCQCLQHAKSIRNYLVARIGPFAVDIG